jgi:hypothetical protein
VLSVIGGLRLNVPSYYWLGRPMVIIEHKWRLGPDDAEFASNFALRWPLRSHFKVTIHHESENLSCSLYCLLINCRLLWNRKWIKWSLGCMRYSTTGEKEAVALQVVKRVDLSQLQLKGLRNPVSRVSDLWTVAAFTLLKCISCYKMLPSFDDMWYCGVSTGTTIQMLLPVCYFEIFHF